MTCYPCNRVFTANQSKKKVYRCFSHVVLPGRKDDLSTPNIQFTWYTILDTTSFYKTFFMSNLEDLGFVEKKQDWTQFNIPLKTGERFREFCKKYNYRLGDLLSLVINDFLDQREADNLNKRLDS